MLLGVGGAINPIPLVGSAALISFIIVETKPCVSGDSGTLTTPLIMSVKWVVFE